MWLLRVSAALVAALVLAQSVLAGLFVTGDVGMLSLHSATASLLAALAFLQVVAAVLVWRPGRGPAWPIWASVMFFLLIEAQSAAGYARALALHIPMGVLMFGLSVALLSRAWSVRRARSAR